MRLIYSLGGATLQARVCFGGRTRSCYYYYYIIEILREVLLTN